jgi:hypothetical protein
VAAMPIMNDKVSYTNLDIRPPVTLQMTISKEKILSAKSKFGQTVDGKTVDNVRWSLEIHVCPPDQIDCATTQFALSIVVSSDRGNNRWLITVNFESYYVSPAPASFQQELFRFGSETDVNVNITIQGTQVSVVANGRPVVVTDTFKQVGQIRTLKANNYFYDPAGAEIAGFGASDLVYNVTIVKGFDVSAILNTVIPLVVVTSVVSIIPKLITRIRG